MKKLIVSLVVISTISLSSFGQAPEGFKYQTVVRDASNIILNNQAVGMRMTIQQGSIGGATVYQETFAPTTNGYGLVNLEIGSGTVVSGTFAAIDWSAGPYFIETAVDATGGTSYVVMGASELMSAPYALHAKTAENVINDAVNDADADPTNEMNTGVVLNGTDLEVTDGNGTIVTDLSTLQDGTGTDDQNISGSGLSGTDLTIGIEGGTSETIDLSALQDVYTAGTGIDITGNVVSTIEPTYTLGLWPELGGYVFLVSADGKHGLVAETVDQGSANWWEAQNLISNPSTHSINGQKFRDWRLPTKYEIYEMYLQQAAIGGFSPTGFWSSTESSSSLAWIQSFFLGGTGDLSKSGSHLVRSVRDF